MVRRTKTKTVLLTLAFTLAWIVVLAPTSLVSGLLPVNLPLVLQGMSGTVWSGSAAQAMLTQNDQVLVQGRLAWRVRPMSLLRLAPCIELSFVDSGVSAMLPGKAAGTACVSADGQVVLHDVTFDLPAGYFLRSEDLRLGGRITGLLTTLTWQADSLKTLNGRGLWSDARLLSDGMNLALQTLPFDLRREADDSFVVQMDNGDLLAQQADTPLHVALQSTVELDGGFHTRAKLTLQSQTPEAVVKMLDVLAEPQGAGVYTLEIRSQP